MLSVAAPTGPAAPPGEKPSGRFRGQGPQGTYHGLCLEGLSLPGSLAAGQGEPPQRPLPPDLAAPHQRIRWRAPGAGDRSRGLRGGPGPGRWGAAPLPGLAGEALRLRRGSPKAKAAALVSLDNASGSSTLDVASGGRKWTLHANGQAVDFPEKNPAPEGEARAFCPDAERLVGVLDFVSPAVCTDETRFNLCGLLLDGPSVVATDGHRLHMERLPAGLPVGWRPILPMSAVRMLRAAAT